MAIEDDALSTIAEALHAIGHELDNHLGILFASLSAARDGSEEERREAIVDGERAAHAIREHLRALRAHERAPATNESLAGIVRLLVAMHRRRGVEVASRMDGELRYTGAPSDAFRLVASMFDVAARAGAFEVRIADASFDIVASPATCTPEEQAEISAIAGRLGLSVTFGCGTISLMPSSAPVHRMAS
jgi:hypothetical protein